MATRHSVVENPPAKASRHASRSTDVTAIVRPVAASALLGCVALCDLLDMMLRAYGICTGVNLAADPSFHPALSMLAGLAFCPIEDKVAIWVRSGGRMTPWSRSGGCSTSLDQRLQLDARNFYTLSDEVARARQSR